MPRIGNLNWRRTQNYAARGENPRRYTNMRASATSENSRKLQCKCKGTNSKHKENIVAREKNTIFYYRDAIKCHKNDYIIGFLCVSSMITIRVSFLHQFWLQCNMQTDVNNKQ